MGLGGDGGCWDVVVGECVWVGVVEGDGDQGGCGDFDEVFGQEGEV